MQSLIHNDTQGYDPSAHEEEGYVCLVYCYSTIGTDSHKELTKVTTCLLLHEPRGHTLVYHCESSSASVGMNFTISNTQDRFGQLEGRHPHQKSH